jgi:hypothetical protein
MKGILRVLAITFIAWAGRVSAGELKASDLAGALGVDWWTIEVPASAEGTVTLGFCVAYADGRKEMSGTMSGFRPGTPIKAFCWPSDKPESLNVSLVSDAGGRMATAVRYPSGAGQIMTYAVPVGGTAKTGQILRKGSTSTSVGADQVLRDGDFGLMVVVQEQ